MMMMMMMCSWPHIYMYFYGVVYVNMTFLDIDTVSLSQPTACQRQVQHPLFQLCSIYNEHSINKVGG